LLVSHSEGIPAVSARKRKTQAQQTEIMIALVCFIIILVNLLLLFADQGFAKAVELIGYLGG
jgi:hypothetical protein